ncbi:hypothetical protein [Salinibacterium sp. ZJ450]|uniref:hypothetical protein n=1 Tax=Salinibacterium sp. ZJ450 TaxID=2708338 RepID=UPI0014200851|nr:hypothetical protein [Salinibacterium sp. ZJ450]
MERLQTRASVAVPVSAIALATGAAVSFAVGDAVGFLSDAAEGVFVVTWLLGWVLLAWAAIIGGGYAVLLGLRRLSRRPVSRSEAVLVAVSLALIAVVMATHPLWGTGSAVG